MDLLSRYPEIGQYLDPGSEYTNTGQEFLVNGSRRLLVTQISEFDGGQILFAWEAQGWVPIDADSSVDVLRNSMETIQKIEKTTTCGPSSSEDQASVFKTAQDQVGVFSSKDGPDGGNLACVWAVRHIIKLATGRMVTSTDGTAVFAPELLACFGATSQEADVPAGSIIISPTETVGKVRNIGHVGLLAEQGKGGSRLIFSNSSAKAIWTQNFTLDSWIARYRTKKGLRILFFPVPLKGKAAATPVA